uniref:tRNA (adenine(58)-N(1))-methyltransferase non-catalytic subunit TRM6 n=1 Tax=Bionectria ochroleuca TaxID=29856 RepID=A0A8H7TR64_BIOOC
MSRDRVQPNCWVALKLPSEDFKILEIVPNITISLGKYGSFPSNLIIDRPYHLTYEIQDKREDENFARLRVVPAAELNADALADTSADAEEGDAEEETMIKPSDGEELTLVDEASGQVVIRSKGEAIDESARQTLTIQEIEELKKKGTAAGKELIAKLLLSHTAIEEKTAYSLAKYKLLKTKKYIRRFTVLPLDVPLLAQWMLEDKDASKIMEMRNESMALVGCWADVHYVAPHLDDAGDESGGRWLVIDDTGGLLTASLAERMGILHENPDDSEQQQEEIPEVQAEAASEETKSEARPAKRRRPDDLELPFAKRNTLTILHHNTQPNLFLLRYFNFDSTDPDPHPPSVAVQLGSPSPPKEAEGKAIEELERWEGNDEYPLNPTLVLNASIQTSRAKRWQVLPGRTHPVMTAKGGAEGYIFTGWRALPVEGRIEARGKFKRKKADPK